MELLLASWQCMSLNYLQTRHCQSPTPPPGKKAVRISKVLHCHVLNVDVAETEALTKISIPLKFEIQIFMRSLSMTIIVTSSVCHWHCRWQSGNLNRTRTKYQSHCQCHWQCQTMALTLPGRPEHPRLSWPVRKDVGAALTDSHKKPFAALLLKLRIANDGQGLNWNRRFCDLRCCPDPVLSANALDIIGPHWQCRCRCGGTLSRGMLWTKLMDLMQQGWKCMANLFLQRCIDDVDKHLLFAIDIVRDNVLV